MFPTHQTHDHHLAGSQSVYVCLAVHIPCILVPSIDVVQYTIYLNLCYVTADQSVCSDCIAGDLSLNYYIHHCD